MRHLNVNGKCNIKMDLQERVRWSGLIWLGMVSGGRLFWMRLWTFGFRKRQGISVSWVHIISKTAHCLKENVSNIWSSKFLLKWKADEKNFNQNPRWMKRPSQSTGWYTINPNVSVRNEALKCSRCLVTIEGTSVCQVPWLHFHTITPRFYSQGHRAKIRTPTDLQYIVRVGGSTCFSNLSAH